MDTPPTTITAPAFSCGRVADVMSPGVLSCAPETPLRTAARMMATYQAQAMIEADAPIALAAQLMSQHRVTHLVVVSPETTRPLGVVSNLDLARALAADTTPYDNSYAG
jgi:CBS domain-containing protein